MSLITGFLDRKNEALEIYEKQLNDYLKAHETDIINLENLLNKHGLEIIGPTNYDGIAPSLSDSLDVNLIKLVNVGRIQDRDLPIRFIFTCNYAISRKFKLPYISISKFAADIEENYYNTIVKPVKYGLDAGINPIWRLTSKDYLAYSNMTGFKKPGLAISCLTDEYLLATWLTYVNLVFKTFYERLDISIKQNFSIESFNDWKSVLDTAYTLYESDINVINTMKKLEKSN